MRRKVRKWICCLGAVAIVFMADIGTVHAEGEYFCEAWKVDSTTEDCRTPICDGVHLTRFIIEKRYKKCTYVNTGYTFTIPDTYVREDGCCSK